MTYTHDNIVPAVAQYAEALGQALNAGGGLAEFIRGLRDPKVRARRLRRRAGRCWRVSRRAAIRGYSDRSLQLALRARSLWLEAQELDPLSVPAAIESDRGAA